jgi:hypothetical protein
VTDTEQAAPAAEEAPAVDVKERLAALAASTRTTRRISRRTATKRAPKKTTSAPKSPAGVRRQKYGDRLVGWAKLGAGTLARDPVQRALLVGQAVELGPIIDSLAEEDPRVAAVLDKIVGWFGKGGAWAKLGGWGVATGGALAMTRGYQHPLLAMMCGPLVEKTINEAAMNIAAEEAKAAGRWDPQTGNLVIDPARWTMLRDELRAQMLGSSQPAEAPTTAVPFQEDPSVREERESAGWSVPADERYAAGPVTVP